MRLILAFIFFVFSFNTLATAGEGIADRRMVLWRDTDFYGGDIRTLLDTSLGACEAACLSDSACRAYTFNATKSACFLKNEIGEKTAFAGAWSGEVVATDPAYLLQAPGRARELGFLDESDLEAAREQAAGLSHEHVVGGWDLTALREARREAETGANLSRAMRLAGGAVVLSDSPSDWAEYARLLLALAWQDEDRDAQRRLRDRAIGAAVNGYLRASRPAQRARLLMLLGEGLEARGRGRLAIPAYRLAQQLSPRDDIAEALDKAIGKYGFRVIDHRVEADSAEPRICAEFSEALLEAGMDYAPYVQSDASGLAVEAQGRALCVTGVTHGQRYRLTLRAGLPAASGEKLEKPVTLNAYVRDRSPAVWFPGRAYVLPATGTPSIPLVGVNASEVALALYRMTDRNLIEAFRRQYLASPMQPWEIEGLSQEMASEIWSGTGTLQTELNREVTTLLPMQEALADQPPGIYMLEARVPGVDPYDAPPATQWFVVSDIGLASMLGADGLHVFARSLASAEPLEGLEVQLISRANDVLSTVTTDARGYAHVPAGLTAGQGARAPALVLVRGADDMGFLSLSEPAFDLSDRGVEGRPAAPPIDLFATTDRGAYRAGEVIHATALARNATAEAIEGLPITAVLMRPDGVEYSRVLSEGVGAGGHVFDLPLGAGVPRGTWRLDFLADPEAPALASRTLLVEDFLPERIDFELSLPQDPISLRDSPELTIDARYLFGAPGADLAIEGDVVLGAATRIEAFPGYRFGRYDDRPAPAYGNLPYDQRTDADGRAVLPVSFPEFDAPGMPVEARIVVRVSEGSGRPVERSLVRLLSPAGPMIGIKPAFDEDLPEGAEARFSLLALGPDLAPAPMQVRWHVNRITTRYQWYAIDGSWDWDAVTRRERIASGEATLGAAPQEIAARLDWGHYELVVEGLGSAAGIASSVDFFAGWYGGADTATTPDMLEMSLDAGTYRPGDTATLRLVPRVAGKVLVTVMSNRLIHMTTLDAVAGENTVTLPVTDEWGAGAYVTATLIQPMRDAEGHLPTRALGLAHAAVDPGAHLLRARFEGPDEAAPRGPLDVVLRVEGAEPGDEVYATIAAVDVGILNLTSFASPDPAAHYFGQRRLGMEIRDLYGRLIDRAGALMGATRSGGDEMAQMRMQAPPPTEALVAMFSGPLRVDEDGRVQTGFDLPGFNGTVRLMAVVWSARGLGQAEKEVLVRDPVVVTASLPRFLAPGDRARLLLELVHAKGPAGEMALSVRGEGVTVDDSALPPTVTLAEGGTARLSVPVSASAPGMGTIRVTLTTPDGTTLTKELSLPVQVNDPEIARMSRFTLAPGQRFSLDSAVFTGLMPGSGHATLSAGLMARLNVAGLLDRLDRYPYGCTEQQTSRALPLLYLEPVARAMGLDGQRDVSERVRDAIAGVLANQAAAGSFGLWEPDSGDLWLDAYVSDFLSRARARGYAVPDTAFRAAMDNLRARVNYAPDFDEGGEGLAYALYVLAREGAAAMGDLRYYADEKGGAFSTPLAAAQLGAALAAYGDPVRADAMFARANAMLDRAGPEAAPAWRDDYGTGLRDAAAVLALSIEAGSAVADREALVARLAQMRGPLSTQEATWALLAAAAMLEEGTSSGLLIDGAPATDPAVLSLDAAEANAPVTVENTGTNAIELTLATFGVPQQAPPAGGQGYAISRRYFSMQGEPVDIAEVTQGTRLVTVLSVQPFGPSDGRLMVNDPLPAGFEIDNPNLLAAGDIRALDWLDVVDEAAFTQFRQERFLAAVDWSSDRPFRLAYVVRAVTPGTYRHPAASVEDMYRPAFRANGRTGTVRITE